MQPASTPDTRALRLGYACAIATLFLWVGFLLTARLSHKQDFTPWDVAALRYAGAFLGALVLAAFLGWPRLPPFRQFVIVLTAGYGFPLFAYHGFSLAPAAHGAVLNAGMLPFYTAALGMWLLGERWTRARGISLGIVAVGIALLATDTFGEHPGAWRGDVMFTLGCICWAVYTVLVRRWGIGAIPATLGSAIWAGPPFLLFWWLFLPSNLGNLLLGPVVFQFVYQGFLAVLASGLLFTQAVTLIGPQRTTAVTAFLPVLAALLAWPLLDEPLGLAGLFGVAIVSAGLLLAVRGPAR